MKLLWGHQALENEEGSFLAKQPFRWRGCRPHKQSWFLKGCPLVGSLARQCSGPPFAGGPASLLGPLPPRGHVSWACPHLGGAWVWEGTHLPLVRRGASHVEVVVSLAGGGAPGHHHS